MIVFKMSDRVPVKMGDATFYLKPLSKDEKAQVYILSTKKDKNAEEVNAVTVSALALKYSVKSVEGLECQDGSPYALSFEPDGTLTDDCVSELLNLEIGNSLMGVAGTWASGGSILKLKGVEIQGGESKKK